jgi:four helix bundle protein
MERKLLRQRVIEFSRSVLIISDHLNQPKQFIIANQLLKSATAIGALSFEAEHAETREDFIHKMKIALKEANETVFWLTICAPLVTVDQKITDDLSVIIKILNKSIVTAKQNRLKKKKEKE